MECLHYVLYLYAKRSWRLESVTEPPTHPLDRTVGQIALCFRCVMCSLGGAFNLAYSFFRRGASCSLLSIFPRTLVFLNHQLNGQTSWHGSERRTAYVHRMNSTPNRGTSICNAQKEYFSNPLKFLYKKRKAESHCLSDNRRAKHYDYLCARRSWRSF